MSAVLLLLWLAASLGLVYFGLRWFIGRVGRYEVVDGHLVAKGAGQIDGYRVSYPFATLTASEQTIELQIRRLGSGRCQYRVGREDPLPEWRRSRVRWDLCLDESTECSASFTSAHRASLMAGLAELGWDLAKRP